MVPIGHRILVVDERRVLAAGLGDLLRRRPGVDEVQVLLDTPTCPAALAAGWDVVVCSENRAEQVLDHAPARTRVLVIVLTPTAPALAALLRLGAAGICTASDLPEDVVNAVDQVAAGELRLPGDQVLEVLTELHRLRSRSVEAHETLARLTDRERDVLTGLAQGRGRAEIARDLGLSPHTVRTHVQHLLHKLSLHSQLEAGAYARDLIAASPPTGNEHDDDVVINLDQRQAERRETHHG